MISSLEKVVRNSDLEKDNNATSYATGTGNEKEEIGL